MRISNGCIPVIYSNGKNVVLIHGFKEYCALLFHKGVLLEDPYDILTQQTKNTQSARQLRFKDLSEVKDQIKLIKKNLLLIFVEITFPQILIMNLKMMDFRSIRLSITLLKKLPILMRKVKKSLIITLLT